MLVKKIVLCLGLIFITSQSFSQVQYDSQQHFVAGMIVSAGTYNLVYRKHRQHNRALLMGVASSIVAGTIKEVIDGSQHGGKFDVNDLLVTGAGGLTMSVTINLFKRNNKKYINYY